MDDEKKKIVGLLFLYEYIWTAVYICVDDRLLLIL